MNQFKRFSIVSIVVFFFWTLNVTCLRGANDNGNTVVPEIKSHNDDQNEDLIISTMEKHGENIANHLVDGIISALEQNATASSFLEGAESFNFKEEAKAHAKMILKEMLKGGLAPLEAIIAESIKPPTIPADIYRSIKPVVVGLFNKVENTLKVDIPDDMWDFVDDGNYSRQSDESGEDEEEEEEDDLDF